MDKSEFTRFLAGACPEARIALDSHDTAQREALARVEAERDGWKEQRDILADYCRRADERARTAQAKLAEAVGKITYLVSAFDGTLIANQVQAMGSAKSFLARHAQAEQQEAHAHPTAHQVGYCGGPGTCLECGPSQAQREAQGAQIGDERAAFEHWASDEGKWPKAVERNGEFYKLAQTQSYWQAWKARAALATQPAGYHDMVEAVDFLEAAADAYEHGYQDGQENPNGYSDKLAKHRVAAELLADVRGAEHE